MKDDMIVWFSATGTSTLLVSEEVKLSGYSQGITPSERVKVKHPTLSLAKI